jgi:hypothetical protein
LAVIMITGMWDSRRSLLMNWNPSIFGIMYIQEHDIDLVLLDLLVGFQAVRGGNDFEPLAGQKIGQ